MVLGSASQKFIHAISPIPASTMSSAEIPMKPPNTTLFPYKVIEETAPTNQATKRLSDSVSDTQYWVLSPVARSSEMETLAQWTREEEEGEVRSEQKENNCSAY